MAYVHVPKEKQRKLDMKVEKCILASYSDEHKCYNPWTKEVRVSRDVVFDKSASWFLPLSPTPIHSIPNSNDEDIEAEFLLDEETIKALE